MRLFWFVLLSAGCALGGDLSARFDLTLHRIQGGGPPVFTDEFILADAVPHDTRRFTNFSGDVSGRYIGAMAMASEHAGTPNEALDRIVTKAIALQKADGHFGAPISPGKIESGDMATLWGNGRLLIGLLEYYCVKPRAEVLASARKLGDFLIAVAPRLNSDTVRREYNGEKFAVGYICWTQNLEGLVELYRVTRDDRYLALAKEIADRTDRHPAQHSHGFLTSLRGMLELSRVTGDSRYLARVESEWKGVHDSGNVLAQGGVPEMFAPQIKRDEGCSEADWLRLSLDLWRATRKPQYLAEAEYTLFNEFSFNQFHTGDFGHHVLTSTGIAPETARAWWCCTFHGLRALAAIFDFAFHEEYGTVYYDLPVDGALKTDGLSLTADSSLGRNGTAAIKVLTSDGRPRTVAVRVPEWASDVTTSFAATRRGGYLAIDRTWAAGDVLTVTYTMRTRLLKPAKAPNHVAVLHGPWLLSVDASTSPDYFDEPAVQNQVVLPHTGDVQLDRYETAGSGRSPFAIPAAHFKLNYLPGGYPVQPGVALLRPIAEFTLGPDENRLDFWLPVKPGQEKLDSHYNR